MMNTRNMKLWFCVACLASSLAAPAPSQGPQLYLDIVDMAAISRMSPEQLETLAEGLAAEEIMRTKRSSAQALSSVASKASSGLQSKVGLLGQASSFLGSASGGSSHGDEHAGYSYEPHGGEKYDYWGLKKSILFTLFQAVKAITGGVTILKGQLIKGGGALAATLGKVISGKGDLVSNLGKKIVSSAALSQKKPSVAPSYGPPPTAHLEYGPPTAYGPPSAPAHFTAPAAPTGYAAHKYPAQLDGRGKLGGIHAGLVFLTPLGQAAPSETLHTAYSTHSGHTALEPPPSILNTVYSAIKSAFSTAPATIDDPHSYQSQPPPESHSYQPQPPHESHSYQPQPPPEPESYQPPPPPQPIPSFKPMMWGAVDSYGEPASDPYAYNPSDSYPPYNYAAPKHSPPPVATKKKLTADKIQKINHNLNKVYAAYMNEHQRSSEDYKLNSLDKYKELLKKGPIPFLPTPVVSDNEIGVLPAELLSDLFTTTTTTTTTTEKPQTTTESDQNRRNDYKYFLRGNKIVQV